MTFSANVLADSSSCGYPILSIPYPQLETNTSNNSSSCHRRSFPIASNSTREMPKKDRIHPFFQAWVGVSRTQRLRRLRHGAMRDLAITINLKRTTRIFRFSCGWTPLFSQRSIAISPWLQAENNWHRPESGAVDGPSLRAEWS